MAVKRETAAPENPVADVMRELVIKECLKGLLGFPVAIAAGFLMSWSSQWSGSPYWIGTIAGLVIFCVALAYFVEFIKLLISGDATKVVAAAIKGRAMKEWMKVFLAFAATLGGTTLSIAGFLSGRGSYGGFNPSATDIVGILTGIILMAVESRTFGHEVDSIRANALTGLLPKPRPLPGWV